MNFQAIREAGVLLVALVAVIGGCTSVNAPLNAQHPQNHTRAALLADPPSTTTRSPDANIQPSTTIPARPAIDPNNDGYFVGIAISGGGSRSANFSAACMFQLQRLGLLQRADYISSVSGGSITGAFYCICSDAEWNKGNVQEKLTHHFATDMIWTMAMPWNAIALMFSDWDRSDVLAATLQKHLYSQGKRALTFADLRPDRPHLLINATDLQSGKPFIFCNETFDQIGSDLSTYPLGYAVAASSAAPVLLHQVTLRDYSTTGENGKQNHYRHLVDGGVVDNLGVKSLVETYRAQLKASNGSAYPRGAVFILLDARTSYDARISTRGDTSVVESLQFSAGLSSTMLLNRASSATLDEIILDSAPDKLDAAALRRERDELINDGYVRLETSAARPVYVLHVALSRVNELKNLPIKDFTDRVNNISTYLNIDPSEARQLYQAADLLMTERFAESLKQISDELNRNSSPPQPPVAKTP